MSALLVSKQAGRSIHKSGSNPPTKFHTQETSANIPFERLIRAALGASLDGRRTIATATCQVDLSGRRLLGLLDESPDDHHTLSFAVVDQTCRIPSR
jgi:hypothetical protein